MAFAIVVIKHRNVIIKEGLTIDSKATPEKNPAVATGAPSPKVIRSTDLEAGKVPMAPPVSV